MSPEPTTAPRAEGPLTAAAVAPVPFAGAAGEVPRVDEGAAGHVPPVVAPPITAAPPELAPAPRDRRSTWVLVGLGAAVLLAAVAFMTVGAKGSWDFVLPFRGTKLLAMTLVGVAVAVSTVMFQTVTDNRILTPSIMGFDALYLLLQTSLVFSIGAARMTAIPAPAKFLLETAVMLTFGVLLYRWLLAGAKYSVHVLVLAGIVLGVFFRSLSSFMQRLIDPNEFQVLQDAMFASFNTFDRSLVWLSGVLLLGAVGVAWGLRRRLDVLLLGRERATMLGVDHRATVGLVLVVVALLVSVSTALVGPITFFGLLVANLAYRVAGSHRHAVVMPVAALLGVLALVAGQTVLERVLAFDTALAVIIELVGGVVFLALLMKGERR